MRISNKIQSSLNKISMMMGTSSKIVSTLMKLPHEYLITILDIDKFKTHRRIMFAIGKTIKYTIWASFVLFWYHMYLLKKT